MPPPASADDTKAPFYLAVRGLPPQIKHHARGSSSNSDAAGPAGDGGPPGAKTYTRGQRIFAACLYGATSIAIMLVNKVVLTRWNFPSSNVLALSQFTCTLGILYAAKLAGYVSFPDASVAQARKVMPLPLIFLLNVLCGLGGTKAVSIPMFSVLRRFNLVFTMTLEFLLFGTVATREVKGTVALMMLGAFIAASNDLAFSAHGYTLIMLNNVFTSSNGVLLKAKLSDAKSGLGTFGLMFYNTLCSWPLLLGFVLAFRADEWRAVLAFEHWRAPSFWVLFLASSVLGCALNYSIYYCTRVTSALTVVVVGCTKNVATTYIGFLLSPDYVFSWNNFAGINVSMVGALYYSWLKFSKKQARKPLLPGGGGGGSGAGGDVGVGAGAGGGEMAVRLEAIAAAQKGHEQGSYQQGKNNPFPNL